VLDAIEQRQKKSGRNQRLFVRLCLLHPRRKIRRQERDEPKPERHQWESEQLHDYVLLVVNTGLRPDQAGSLNSAISPSLTTRISGRGFSKLKCAENVEWVTAKACLARSGRLRD